MIDVRTEFDPARRAPAPQPGFRDHLVAIARALRAIGNKGCVSLDETLTQQLRAVGDSYTATVYDDPKVPPYRLATATATVEGVYFISQHRRAATPDEIERVRRDGEDPFGRGYKTLTVDRAIGSA